MPRILEPGQIEASAGRAIPRIRLPERTCVFSARARRLRQLAEAGAPGHAIGDYLRLMALMADAQQLALGSFEAAAPNAHQLARAATHRMPVIHAGSWPRAPYWREVVMQLCGAVAAARDAPAGVRATCERLQSAAAQALETQADALLAGRAEAVEVGAAPFLMGALQVHWVRSEERRVGKECRAWWSADQANREHV